MTQTQSFNTEIAALIMFAYYVGRQAPIKQEQPSSLDIMLVSAQKMAAALSEIHSGGTPEC